MMSILTMRQGVKGNSKRSKVGILTNQSSYENLFHFMVDSHKLYPHTAATLSPGPFWPTHSRIMKKQLITQLANKQIPTDVGTTLCAGLIKGLGKLCAWPMNAVAPRSIFETPRFGHTNHTHAFYRNNSPLRDGRTLAT
ncbi:MAG: hypothetical protein PHV02_13720 [Rhodocyclaceae bacterium]|nr:hypothetical protein [Rhodocyclaceae bacterium]